MELVSGFPPAVIVHGLDDARAALAPGQPVTLLSAPGAALYAGCGWWRALVDLAQAERPEAEGIVDILDCADAAGQAFAALRLGQRWLVLAADAPGCAAVAAVAAAQAGGVLTAPPPALDLAAPDATRVLTSWLGPRGLPPTAPERDVTSGPSWARRRRR